MKLIQSYQIFLLCTIGRIVSNTEILRSSSRRHGILQVVAQNARLDASVIETVVADTLLICTMKCINNLLCKSINYNAKAQRCEKLSENRLTVGESKLIAANSWEHYEPRDLKTEIEPACHTGLHSSRCGPFQKCEADLSKIEGFRCVDLQNIALGKATANQPEAHFPASRAIDGNSNADWGGDSCTATSCCDPLPWWRVDFGGTATVYSMKITNRGDCCGERLYDFNVRVGDHSTGRGDHNQLCQQNAAVPEGKTSAFTCSPPLHGRYLYIQTNLHMSLNLCEVEVFGEIST